MTDVLNWKDSYDNTQADRPHVQRTADSRSAQFRLAEGCLRQLAFAEPFSRKLTELTFIAEGNYTFRIGGADYPLKGGELFIAYPNEIHSTNQLAMSVGEFYWLQLDPGCPGRFSLPFPKGRRLLQKQLLFGGRHVLSVNRKEIFGLASSLFLRPGGRGGKRTAIFALLFL